MTDKEFADYQMAVMKADDERILQACEAAERELGPAPSFLDKKAFEVYSRKHYQLFREKLAQLN